MTYHCIIAPVVAFFLGLLCIPCIVYFLQILGAIPSDDERDHR